MNPVVMLLSILDLVAGILVYFSYSGIETAVGKVVLYLAIFHIIKGAWSILSSFAFGIVVDVLGWIDLVAGIMITLALYGVAFNFAYVIGMIMMLKGAYCIFFSL